MKILCGIPKAILFLLVSLFYSCQTNRVKQDETIIIPFVLENNRIVIQATVNGKEGRYFWETGGDGSLTTVPLDNLPIADERIYTVRWIENGIVINNQIIASRSLIGNPAANRPGSEAVSYNLQRGQFDGFIGAMAFSGYWCEVSFSENKIALYRNKPAGFLQSVPTVMLSRTHFGIPITINEKEIYCLVDTGMPDAFRFPKALPEQLGIEPRYEIITANETLAYGVKTNIITVFDDIFTDKIVHPDSFFDDTIGMIGVEYLYHYNLLFDFTSWGEDNLAGLYYASRFPDIDKNTVSISSFEKPRFGAGFNAVEQGVKINSVVKPSIAYDDFDLRPGVIITHINGKSVDYTISDAEIIKLINPLAADEDGEITILDLNGQKRTIRRSAP